MQPGLRTSGLNDTWVHEMSVDLFQVSRDPHAPRPSEATDVGRAVEEVGTEDGVRNPTWDGPRTLPWACWGALTVTAKISPCVLNTYSIQHI